MRDLTVISQKHHVRFLEASKFSTRCLVRWLLSFWLPATRCGFA